MLTARNESGNVARSRGLAPSWVRKCIVASLGIATFLWDHNVKNSELPDALTLGLLVGVLAAIFETQFSIVDAASSNQAVLIANQRLIQNEVGDVSRLNKLRDRIQSDFGSKYFVNELLEYEWKRFQGRLEALANGSLKAENFVSLISAAASNEGCKSILGVTTLPAASRPGTSGNWWLSKAGKEYSQMNFAVAARSRESRGAARSGVERIWVYRNVADLADGSNVELLREHAANGIRVRIYRWQRDGIVPNFTIWNEDDKAGGPSAWEATLNWDGEMISGTFYASPEEVKRLQEEWRRIRRDSQLWRDPHVRGDGSTRLAVVPVLASPTLPTVAEVASGVQLELLPEFTLNLLPLQIDSRVAATGKAMIGDEQGKPQSSGDQESLLSFPGGASEAEEASCDLLQAAAGYVIVRRGEPATSNWAQAQEVEVYPVRWRPRGEIAGGICTVELSRNGDPVLDAQLVADAAQ